MEKKTLKDWIIATKPWSFNVSASSVIITSAYLYYNMLVQHAQEPDFHPTSNDFDWLNAVIALVMIICFHAAGNLLSDYRDYIYGIDKPGNDNEVKWISGGLFSPKEIRNFGYAMLVPATLLGILLLQRAGWEVAWIGVLGIIFAGAYSFFKFHAMGDLDIICCYALLPSIGTSFVVTGEYHYEVLLLSLTYGLFTNGLLHYNNTRDIESDSQAGITTLPILVGLKVSKYIYLCFEMLPFVITMVLIVVGILPLWALLVFLTFPSALKLVRMMLSSKTCKDLDGYDLPNAQQQLKFSLFLLLGIICGMFI